MNSNSKCKQCLIQEDTRLLMDFFAVSKDDLSENITSVILNETGICQYCQLYKQNYDQEYIDYELSYFVSGSQENKYHSIVALSGGKDSIAALYLAKNILKLNVIAMTYDNGFIPKSVIEQSQKICDLLDVPYIVMKEGMYKEFKNEYQKDNNGEWIAKTGIDFCELCSKNIWKYLKKISTEYGIYKVILGNKIYSRLTPEVSCTKKFKVYDGSENKVIMSINLPFALQMSKSDQQEILILLNWKNPDLKGYTSNCLIPGFTEFPRKKKINTESDAGYVEMELRSGMYSKKEAEGIILNKKYSDNSKEIDNFLTTIS